MVDPLALHLHAAVRGVVTESVLRQVVAATYHQVWRPQHEQPVYTGRNLPVWSDKAAGYVDPVTGQPLATWSQAMRALDDPNAEPAHVVWFGTQLDRQWFIAGTNRADKRIGYLTKYLTKSIAETYDPDAVADRQQRHLDRLHRETRFLPCSTRCPKCRPVTIAAARPSMRRWTVDRMCTRTAQRPGIRPETAT
jgi:replication initiator protein RepSA